MAKRKAPARTPARPDKTRTAQTNKISPPPAPKRDSKTGQFIPQRRGTKA